MSKIVGIGACVFDTLYNIPSYPKEDTKLRATASKTAGGGPVATGLVAAQKLGVDIGAMYVSQPDTGEQALEIAEQLVRSGAVDIITIDSVAALVPKAEIDGEMGDSHVGLQARLMSQALRKLTGVLNKSNTVAIFINQLREKVGVMFGNPETTPGGRALKFYSTIRLDVRRSEALKIGEIYVYICQIALLFIST